MFCTYLSFNSHIRAAVNILSVCHTKTILMLSFAAKMAEKNRISLGNSETNRLPMTNERTSNESQGIGRMACAHVK